MRTGLKGDGAVWCDDDSSNIVQDEATARKGHGGDLSHDREGHGGEVPWSGERERAGPGSLKGHGLACHRVRQRSHCPYMEDFLGRIPRLVVKDGESSGEGVTLEDLEAATGHPTIHVHYSIRKESLADGALARGLTGRSQWRRWGPPLCCHWVDGCESQCDKGQQKHEQTASEAE